MPTHELLKAQHITSVSKNKHFSFSFNIFLHAALFAEAHSEFCPYLKEFLWLEQTVAICVQGTCSRWAAALHKMCSIRMSSGSSFLMFAFVNDQWMFKSYSK